MSDNQRGLLWAVVFGVLLLLLASRLLPPVFVVLVAVVLVLGAAVGWSRVRDRQAGGADDWDRGDEWGVGALGETDEDTIDLAGTLDIFAPEPDQLHDDQPPADPVSPVEPISSLFAPERDEISLDEEVSATRSIFDDVAVPTEVADLVDEEYVDPDAAVRARSVSIFADDGAIDEHVVGSDASILAAATASSFSAPAEASAPAPASDYNQVLERDAANAETREILSRVANLLEKYE